MNGTLGRGALALITAVTACFLVWILGTMWNEAERVSSSANRITSPAQILWTAQLALMAVLLRAGAARTGLTFIMVVALPMPIWVFLGLAEVVETSALLRAHLAVGFVGLLLTGFGAILARIADKDLRACSLVGIQALCAIALFGVTYRLWFWVSA